MRAAGSDGLKQKYESLLAQKGAAHEETLQSLFGLANALISEGRYEEAEGYGRQLLKVFEDNFGENHPNTAYGLDIIATTLREQGRSKEAVNLGETALARLQAHFGNDHEVTLQRVRRLAILYGEVGEFEKAEELISRYDAHFEKSPKLFADITNTRAFLAAQSGNPEKALELNNNLLLFYKEHGQENTAFFASTQFNTAQILVNLNQKRKAFDILDKAVITANRTYGPDHPKSQDMVRLHTRLKRELGL